MEKIDLGSYSFTIEHNGKTVESPELKIFDGVRLFPLRYGLFRKEERTEKNVYPENGKSKVLDGRNNFYPKVEQFGYYLNPMILHNGWVYVYSHTTKSVYVYKCTNNSFQLEEIKKTKSSTDTSDCMEQCLGHSYQYIPLLSNDKVQIYYSAIELSKTFIETKYTNEPVIGEPFNCKEWIDYTTASNVMHGVVDANDVWFMFDTLLVDDAAVSNSINEQYKATINTVKLQNSEQKTQYRDVFFIIDDPVGCATKLQYDLNDARINHEALLRSIRTGVSPSEIKKLLLKSDNGTILDDMALFKTYDLDCTEQIGQAQQIHALALYFYNFIYPKKETHLKSGESALKKDFFKKLFATDERKRNRKSIEDIRLLINQLVLSPVFQNHCKMFTIDTKDTAENKEDELHARMKMEMQTIVMDLITSWKPVPHINDKGLDMEGTYDNYKDICESTIKDIFNSFIGEGSCPVGMFLKDIPILAGVSMDAARDIISKSAVTTASAILLLGDSVTNSWWRFAYEAQKTTLLIEKFKLDPEKLLIGVKKGNVTEFLNKQGRTLYDANVIDGRGVIWIKVKKISDLDNPQIEVNTIAKNPTKYQKLLKCLEMNNSYLSILSFIQLAAIMEGYNKNQTGLEIGIKSLEFASAAATIQRRFVESSLELRQVSLSGQASNAIRPISAIQTQMAVLGAVGMFCGAVDAVINMIALNRVC